MRPTPAWANIRDLTTTTFAMEEIEVIPPRFEVHDGRALDDEVHGDDHRDHEPWCQ